MQGADVLAGHTALGANFIYKARYQPADGLTRFTWVLFLEAGLCICTVALCNTVRYAVARTLVMLVVIVCARCIVLLTARYICLNIDMF